MATPHEQPQSNPGAAADLPLDAGRFVSNLVYAVERGLARIFAPYDLHPLDVHLLMLVREMEQCTATQLAVLLPVDAARISRLVNALAEKDLLLRRRQRDDRRVIMLRLSPEGAELTAEIARRMQEYDAALTQGLSEQEVRAFFSAAQRIIDNCEQMANS